MPTIFEEDLNDTFIWTSRETARDENGVIQGRYTVFDDGVVRSDVFEQGTLSIRQEEDGPMDAKPWQSLEQYFDQDGAIQARIELRDNDVLIESVYENGVIHYKSWADDPMTDATNWQQIEEYYDINGERVARIELRDDNVLIETVYEDGVIANRSWTDDPMTDATNWQNIEEYYDQNGERVARIELRDNDVSITSEYDNGNLVVRTQEDLSQEGGPSWQTHTSYYSGDGDLEAREVVHDNADITATFYEDGVRSLRLQFDGDDSNAWLVREILYDEAGQVAQINTFDTAEEVPAEYGFWDWTV